MVEDTGVYTNENDTDYLLMQCQHLITALNAEAAGYDIWPHA